MATAADVLAGSALWSCEAADAVACEGEDHLGVRSPDEVDRGGRSGLVHRHRRGAIARDTCPAVERLGKPVPECSEDVLDGVVLVDVEVAAGQQLEVEAAVEREERQQVVEEADARGDPRATATVEVERDAECSLGGRAQDDGRTGYCRFGSGTERSQPAERNGVR